MIGKTGKKIIRQHIINLLEIVDPFIPLLGPHPTSSGPRGQVINLFGKLLFPQLSSSRRSRATARQPQQADKHSPAVEVVGQEGHPGREARGLPLW